MPATTVSVTTDDHPAQQAFVDDRNTKTGYIGGVGSGKTTGGVFRAGRHVSDWNEGHTGVIVCPTVPMLRNVIVDELRQWGLLDKPGIEYRRSENRIEYPNGSTIILESANNDRKIERLRGLNLAWAWMDEAAYLPEKVYRILSDRLRVGNYRNLFATTTPRGFNWLYDVFGDIDVDGEPIADGKLLRGATTTSIVGVSTRANPGNPEDYIEREERQHTGESYHQEVEGEFTKFSGLIFPWFGDDNLVDEAPERYDEAIYGVDWGHNNPSTVLALVRDGETWTAVEEHYETRWTVNDHSRAMQDMQERWGPGRIYCDPSEPANIEQFQRDGLDAKAAENDVTPGIQHVSSMREDLHVVETCQNLRNEFSQYQYKDGQDKPEKANDHLMDSLRYALFTHANTTPKADPFPFQ
jgi:PBSX family phage terminase large subunit